MGVLQYTVGLSEIYVDKGLIEPQYFLDALLCVKTKKMQENRKIFC